MLRAGGLGISSKIEKRTEMNRKAKITRGSKPKLRQERDNEDKATKKWWQRKGYEKMSTVHIEDQC